MRRITKKDQEIGQLIRAQRLARGMSQSELADHLGLTFQQIQKYEKGTNRVGAGRLDKIAEFLNVPITFFYGETGLKGPQSEVLELLSASNAVRVLRGFAAIKSSKVKSAVVDLIESLEGQ
jgi:transcriptional regulator with XRE-family HTH domain